MEPELNLHRDREDKMAEVSRRTPFVRDLVVPATFFLIFFGLGAIQPFLIPFLRQRQPDLTPVQCSVVLAVVYFAFAVSRLFAGHLIYRVTSKRAICLGALGYFLFVLLVYVLNAYPLLLLAAVIWGIAAAMLWTAGSTHVLDSSASSKYGRRCGVLNLVAKIGITLGVATLGLVLRCWGYTGLFRVALAVGGLGVLVAGSVPNNPQPPKLQSFRELSGFYFRERGLLLAALFVAPGLAYGQLLGLINLYVVDTAGKAYVGGITASFLASGVLFSYLAGELSDQLGRRLLLIASFLAGAMGLVVMAQASQPFVMACAALLFGVQFGAVPTVVLAWIGDHTQAGARALAHASIFAWRDVGIGTSIVLGGSLIQSGWAYRTVFLAFASLFLLAAAASWGVPSANSANSSGAR